MAETHREDIRRSPLGGGDQPAGGGVRNARAFHRTTAAPDGAAPRPRSRSDRARRMTAAGRGTPPHKEDPRRGVISILAPLRTEDRSFRLGPGLMVALVGRLSPTDQPVGRHGARDRARALLSAFDIRLAFAHILRTATHRLVARRSDQPAEARSCQRLRRRLSLTRPSVRSVHSRRRHVACCSRPQIAFDWSRLCCPAGPCRALPSTSPSLPCVSERRGSRVDLDPQHPVRRRTSPRDRLATRSRLGPRRRGWAPAEERHIITSHDRGWLARPRRPVRDARRGDDRVRVEPIPCNRARTRGVCPLRRARSGDAAGT